MKKALFIFSIAFILAFVTVSSSIQTVTVYEDRAIVERSHSENLKKGEFNFFVPNIPYSVDQNSINVEVSDGRIKIYSVTFKTVYHKQESNLEVERIKKKIKELIKNRTFLENDNSSYKNQIETLRSIKAKIEDTGSKDLSRTAMNIDNLSASISFITSSLTKALNRIFENSEKIQSITEDINYNQKLLNELNQQGKKENRIYISGNSAEAGNYKFNVRYLTYGVKWYPIYRAYLSDERENVEFEYYAMVTQNTGEDWENVNLIFSTSQPRISISAPKLDPLYLYNIRIAERKKAKSLSPAMARESVYDKEVLSEAPDEIITEEIETGYAVEFRSNLRQTVPSGSEQKQVFLKTQKLEGEFIYTFVPRMSDKGYAQIKSENKMLSPILAGKVSLFYGNSYIGDYYIENVLPGEEFTLSLGPVNYFKVEFKLEKRKYTPPTLFSSNKKYEFEYSFKINNLKDQPFKIEVYDRVPVSNDNKIKIDKEIITPKDFEKDPNNGILKWEIEIPKKGVMDFKLQYNVEFPKDYNVNI